MKRILVAALVALAALLVIDAILTDRETKPPSADLGHTYGPPGGRVQVREDGQHGRRAIVLLHGFAASMHWWSPVTERLAPHFYVLRVDLLGHGGSEKPRHGYSMENQARLVSDVLSTFHVTHAAVVG